MDPREAALEVLREDGGELHWTVVWDRALRTGKIDPLSQPDARPAVMKALSQAVDDGTLAKTSKGTYRWVG